MVRRAMVTAGKVLVAIGIFFVVALLLLTLPDCAKLRAMVVNDGSSDLEDVTLSIRDRVVWSGRLEIFGGRRIAVAEGGEGVFVLRGRYAESGVRFERSSTYVTSFDQFIHLFLVKHDGIYAGSWRDPSRLSSKEMIILDEVRIFGALFLDLMSCADHALWTSIRGSPEY